MARPHGQRRGDGGGRETPREHARRAPARPGGARGGRRRCAAPALVRARLHAARVRAFARAALDGAARAGRAGRARGRRSAWPRSWRSRCSPPRACAPGLRWVAATAVALGAVALALLAGGVADEYLRPDHWGELLSGVGRGIDALPGRARAVPRPGRVDAARDRQPAARCSIGRRRAARVLAAARRAPGFPAAALIALVTLYVVPAVVLDFDGEFLRGAVLGAADARVPAAREAARARRTGRRPRSRLVAATGALIAAPALDGRDPWFDYESWALETAGTKRSTFSWDHDYSPLDWPRDGRELLRVKARAAGLLEGARPRPVRRPRLAPGSAPAQRRPGGAAPRQPDQPRRAGASASR